MAIRAGDLRHRITIRRKAKVQDDEGGFETLWATVATVWAKVEGLDAREAMMADALQGVSSYRVTIRYGANVKTGDQLILDGDGEFNIASISDPDGRRERLMLMASTASVQDEAA